MDIAEIFAVTKLQQHQLSRVNKFKKHTRFFTKIIVPARCKTQCLEYAETVFNIRLYNRENDGKITHSKTLLASKHFQEKNHDFNKHAKLIIIDKLAKTKTPKEILRQRLIQRETF